MNNQRKDSTMIAEQIQQTEARLDHEHALALAAQAVVDAAANLGMSHWEEYQYIAAVPLGMMQDLANAIDAWRSLGGQTTDERSAVGMEDHYFSKGTTLNACAQCGHPLREHYNGYQCTCRNADDSGSCRCQRFIAKRGTS